MLLNVALLSCSLVVSFFLGEGLLRTLDYLDPCRGLPSIADPLVWNLRPAHRTVHMRCPEFTTTVTTNSSGFRGPEFPSKEHPGHKRVLFLGDSFVEAMEVEENERFPRLIDDALGESADAVILGYAGSSPVHALAYYRHIGRTFNPDLVVHAFYVVNDILEESKEIAVPADAEHVTLRLHPDENWRLWLGRNSLLVQMLYDRVYRPLVLLGSDTVVTAQKAAGPFYKFTKEGGRMLEEVRAWENTIAVMKTLRAEAEADGARFMIIVIPPYFSVHEERKEELMRIVGDTVPGEGWEFDLVQQRLLQEFAKAGLRVVDPTAALRAGVLPEERVYFAEDPHITKKGHRIVAEEALSLVRSLLGL